MHEGRLSADAITRERASSQRRTGVERERRFLSSRRIGIRRASFSLHLRAAAAAALPLAPIYTPRRAQSSAGGRIPSPPRQNSLSLSLALSVSFSPFVLRSRTAPIIAASPLSLLSSLSASHYCTRGRYALRHGGRGSFFENVLCAWERLFVASKRRCPR